MAPLARKLREFVEAVHALSADPSTRNVNRYLAASRALDHVQAGGRRRGGGATQPKVSKVAEVG